MLITWSRNWTISVTNHIVNILGFIHIVSVTQLCHCWKQPDTVYKDTISLLYGREVAASTGESVTFFSTRLGHPEKYLGKFRTDGSLFSAPARYRTYRPDVPSAPQNSGHTVFESWFFYPAVWEWFLQADFLEPWHLGWSEERKGTPKFYPGFPKASHSVQKRISGRR